MLREPRHTTDVQGWVPDLSTGPDADFVDMKFDMHTGSSLPVYQDIGLAPAMSSGPVPQAMPASLVAGPSFSFQQQHHRSQYQYVAPPNHLPSPPTTRNNSPITHFSTLYDESSPATASSRALSAMVVSRCPNPAMPANGSSRLGGLPTPAASSAASSAVAPKRPKNSTQRKKERKLAENANYVPRPRNSFIIFRTDFVKSKMEGKGVNGSVPGCRSASASGSGSGGEDDEPSSSLSKQASEVWNKMSDTEKEPWQKLAEEEKQEHARKYPNYRYRPSRQTHQQTPQHPSFHGAPAPGVDRGEYTSSLSDSGYRSDQPLNAPIMHDQHGTQRFRHPEHPQSFSPYAMTNRLALPSVSSALGATLTSAPEYFSMPQLYQSNIVPMPHLHSRVNNNVPNGVSVNTPQTHILSGSSSCPTSPDKDDYAERDGVSPLSSVSSLPTSPPQSPEEIAGCMGPFYITTMSSQDQASLSASSTHVQQRFVSSSSRTVCGIVGIFTSGCHAHDDDLSLTTSSDQNDVGDLDNSLCSIYTPSQVPAHSTSTTTTSPLSPLPLFPQHMTPLKAVAYIHTSTHQIPKVSASSLESALIDTTELPRSNVGQSTTPNDGDSDVSTVRESHSIGGSAEVSPTDASEPSSGDVVHSISPSILPSPVQAYATTNTTPVAVGGDPCQVGEVYGLAVDLGLAGNEASNSMLQDGFPSQEYGSNYSFGSGELELTFSDYLPFGLWSQSMSGSATTGNGVVEYRSSHQDWSENVGSDLAAMEDVRY